MRCGAAVLVAISLIGAACADSASPTASPVDSTLASAETAPPPTLTGSPPPVGGFREIGAGVAVGDTTLDLSAAVAPTSVVAPSVAGTEVWGEVFQVTATLQPTEPVTVRLPVPGPIPDGSAVTVMVASSPGGPWEPLETAQVLVDGKVEAITPHFSFFSTLLSPFVDLLGELKRIFNDATGGFVAEAAQPACASEDVARTTVAVTSTAADTLKWCLGVENGVTILRVTNNRRYSLQASFPGLTVIDANLDPTSAQQISARLDKSLVLLAPRRSVTFHVDTGTARLTTEFNGLANSLYQLQIGIETLLSILSRFGIGGGDAVAKTAALLQSPKCASTMFDPTGGNIVANCFSPGDIVRAFGPKAVFAAAFMAVGPVIEFFHSQFNALGDLLSGRDRYEIVTTALAPVPPVPVTPVTLIPEPDTGPLFLGHQGSRVFRLQSMLHVVGKLSANPDGEFGHATEDAVIAFQRDVSLVADGIAGAATMHALDVAVGGTGYATMQDANQAVLTLLNTGAGVPPNGWLAQDLAAMNSPGFSWLSNSVTQTEITFTQGSDDGGGVFSVLSLAFEQHDGLFWYAGITLQEGH